MATSFACDSRALAETYDRLSDTQFENGKNLVEHLGSLEGAHVLDVGCGTGRLARWIADRVGTSGTVVGIDPLAERVAIARAKGRGIRFEVGRAEDLSAFTSGSFDAVCMSSVLHWVTDKPQALAEARRVLKPSGRLGVTTLSREFGPRSTLFAPLTEIVQHAPYANRIRGTEWPAAPLGQTTSDLLCTVMNSGFEIAEVHITRRCWKRASGQELVEFLESSSFGNLLHAVPEDLRDRLRADLAAAYDARKDRDGILVKAWTTLLIAVPT
jgi:ubiquinone/menaquinone biosynthesis C-methylase UbiE